MVVLGLLLVGGGGACAHHAARIPRKASGDMACPETQLTVTELGGGDRGAHFVSGCGKKATYELNPLGDWVLTGPVVQDPTYVQPATE